MQRVQYTSAGEDWSGAAPEIETSEASLVTIKHLHRLGEVALPGKTNVAAPIPWGLKD